MQIEWYDGLSLGQIWVKPGFWILSYINSVWLLESR